MTKKAFFKGLATLLLLPGGFVFVVAVAAVVALALAFAVYVALFCAVVQWAASEVRYLVRYGWRSAPNREAARADGRPEGNAYSATAVDPAAAANPPHVGSTTSLPQKNGWLQ